MRTTVRWTLIAGLGLVLVGCAAPRYNLDVRNMTAQVVNLDLVARNDKEKGEPRTIARGRVGPGSNISLFTEGQRGDKARLEAKVEGDERGEPATLNLTSGLSSIDIIGMPEGSKTRVRLREVVRE